MLPDPDRAAPPATATFQHGGHRVWLLVYAVFCAVLVGVLVALVVRSDVPVSAGRLASTLDPLAVTVACLWLRRARIEVDEHAVTVVNPWRRHRVTWDALDDVRVGSVGGIAYPIEVVDAANNVVRSFGVMEVRFPVGPSAALHRIAADIAQGPGRSKRPAVG